MELSIYSPSSLSNREIVFERSYTAMSPEYSLLNDPLAQPYLYQVRGTYNVPPGLLETQWLKLLFFESFAFEFAVAKRWEDDGDYAHSFVEVKVAGEILSGITTLDATPSWHSGETQLWLLLTRHVDEGYVVHNFILLGHADEHFYRADMLRLEFPVDKLWLLQRIGIHRLRGVLS
jgi:hypothetical protein